MKIERFSEIDKRTLLMRGGTAADVSAAVASIVQDVEARGDEALLAYTLRFDGVRPDPLEVPRAERQAALLRLEPALREAMELAASNIRAYHAHQVRGGFRMDLGGGSYLGQIVTPIERVGLYIPGGTAAYPSTVFMNAIPASLAGCREIVMVSPACR